MNKYTGDSPLTLTECMISHRCGALSVVSAMFVNKLPLRFTRTMLHITVVQASVFHLFIVNWRVIIYERNKNAHSRMDLNDIFNRINNGNFI